MTTRPLLLSLCSLLLTIGAFAQTPVNIQLTQPLRDAAPGTARLACADQDAGSIQLVNFSGQSNDFDPTAVTFLCLGDAFEVDHLGDFDLTGDPDPSTAPGIGYGFYSCAPTVAGPDLTTILTDPCIDNTSPIVVGGTPIPQTQGIWIAPAGTTGDLNIENTGDLQSSFDGGNVPGDPIQFFFAPITVDDINNPFGPTYEDDNGVTGPCVNVSTGEAFSVVYLNAITTGNQNTDAGLQGCTGSFEVFGGVSEFEALTDPNPSSYTITIEKTDEPGVLGTVTSGAATHGSTVTFDVPRAGEYLVTVEDDKSCGASFVIDMTACVTVTFDVGTAAGLAGGSVCVPVTVADFVDIESFQFSLNYDPAVLQFTGVQDVNPALGSGLLSNSPSPGEFITSFLTLGANVDLPDGTVLFSVCFDVLGMVGDDSDIFFVNNAGNPLEASNGNGVLLVVTDDGNASVALTTLLADVVGTDVSCNPNTTGPSDDGSFTLTITGGAAPYSFTYSLQGSGVVSTPQNAVEGTPVTVNGLDPGTYDIVINDSDMPPGVLTTTVDIMFPAELGLGIDSDLPDCFGDGTDIVLTAVPTIGGQPVDPALYTFNWSNGDTGPMTTSTLTPGIVYEVTVTSAGGCQAQASETPSPPTEIMTTINITPGTCDGSGDGAINLTVTGGTPDFNGAYTIEWPTVGSGLTLQSNTSNLNGLSEGTYPLIVTDDNGCSINREVEIFVNKPFVLDSTIVQINCNGDCNGDILVEVTQTGGPLGTPYNFTWMGVPPPPGVPTNTATSTQLSNLCAGTYRLQIIDQDGCNTTRDFILNEPELLVVDSLSSDPATCVPGMDGEAVVSVTGGVYPYQYAWNETMQTDSVLNNVNAGEYTVTVTDFNGCVDSVDIIVAAPLGPQITQLDDDNVNCSGSTDGSLTVSATAGNAAITDFQWSNGADGTTISNLGAGLYTVTVIDAAGCGAVDTAFVLAPDPLVVDSIAAQSPNCPDGNDGQATVFVSGGTGPYTYFWSDDPNTASNFNLRPGLAVGTYSVTVIDANNCPPIETQVTIDPPPSIVVSFDPAFISAVSCANAAGVPCDGTAQAMAMYSDGTTGLFDFEWESGETTANSDVSSAAQLCEGWQTVTVGDQFCTVTDSVFIEAPDPISVIELVNERVSCNGDTDGELTVEAQGGVGGFSYVWLDGPTTPDRDMLAPGNYTVSVTDANMCTFLYQTSIDEPDPFQVVLNQSATFDVSCNGAADGTINVDTLGGNSDLGGITFNWGNNIAGPNSDVATGLDAGTYFVTATDSKGCADSLVHTISEPPAIQYLLGDIDPILCNGDRTTIVFDQVIGGNGGPYLVSVDNAPPQNIDFGFDVFGGVRDVTIFDVTGCAVDTTINIPEPPRFEIFFDPDEIEVELGDSAVLTPIVSLGGAPVNQDSIFWSPLEFLSFGGNRLRPTVRPLDGLDYTLTAFDQNGCQATASIFVDVDKNRNIFVPNAFYPGSSRGNDRFRVFAGPGVQSIVQMQVWDRWGELVFQEGPQEPSSFPSYGWDGKFRGEEMNTGVYVYIITVLFEDGLILNYRGSVTLLR